MHQSVLLDEVVSLLNLKNGSRVIDATLGSGGHSMAILKKIGKDGKLLGLDADPRAIARFREDLKAPNCILVNGWFDQLTQLAQENDFKAVDAILFDLGMASDQLDSVGRGFSFQTGGPLDMRLDQSQRLTAAEVVNRWNEKKLADTFYQYGELYSARSIAKRIIFYRAKQPLQTTDQLVAAVGFKNPSVLAQLFQAIRIAVNDELGRLERAIPQAVELLVPGGRLAIISFHSLEDRIVKNSFRGNHLLKIITPKPITPSEEEVNRNSRARSAKLRVAEKLA